MNRFSGNPLVGLSRLEAAAEDGRLAALAEKHDLTLIVVFGSVVAGADDPNDLDVAVEPADDVNIVDLYADLIDLTGCEAVDVMDLRRAGVVAREAALGRGVPLFETTAGHFAEQQMIAVAERMETRWLRDVELEMLAGR
ncbi:MAG: nucleotidyltransferase domain-containing protein [Euzebyales bacterium]|jgi:predicted nucleotidyltransferase|nr:nucleotidyltransferase domain-containing protein [Euzebyales bacterium]